jgi:hypothetical protein
MIIKRFSEMNEQQFEKIIDNYIDRAAAGQVDVPADVFFDLLAQRLSQQVDETVTLLVDIENNDLTLRPDREFADVVIRGNEIIIGHHRFILQLSPPQVALPAPAQ